MIRECLLDAKHYAAIRHRLLKEKVAIGADHEFPFLIREVNGGKPTGRWMVLDCTHGEPRRWAWPPIASSNSTNAAAERMTS